jgi:membrane protease YdiL (CAAX protease family)
LKDAARLLVYFAATVLLGALLAPVLFRAAQWLAAHQILASLARFRFETFFDRALLIAAVTLLWPLLRSLRVRTLGDLGLVSNPHPAPDVGAGFLFAAVPLLCVGALLIAVHVFSLRVAMNWAGAARIAGATLFVPLIEEAFFRGLILGVLLKRNRAWVAIALTSALYSILHFLKSTAPALVAVTWSSGFVSVAHSFSQFADPLRVAGGFTTLFLIGWVLADARLRTRSLWLPMGLHGGWIFANGLFNKFAHSHGAALPWLGKSLLVGIVPLAVVGLTWAVTRGWLRKNEPGKA